MLLKSTVVQIHKIMFYATESCLSFVTVRANVEQSWKKKCSMVYLARHSILKNVWRFIRFWLNLNLTNYKVNDSLEFHCYTMVYVSYINTHNDNILVIDR